MNKKNDRKDIFILTISATIIRRCYTLESFLSGGIPSANIILNYYHTYIFI